jgi:hypothetical protein
MLVPRRPVQPLAAPAAVAVFLPLPWPRQIFEKRGHELGEMVGTRATLDQIELGSSKWSFISPSTRTDLPECILVYGMGAEVPLFLRR